MVCEKTELICENTELLCENSKHFTKVEVSLLGFHRNYQNRQFMQYSGGGNKKAVVWVLLSNFQHKILVWHK